MSSSAANVNDGSVAPGYSTPNSLCRHFGLRENPFGVTPNPRYLYESSTHQEALNALVTGIECGIGFQALVAMPGMGKTTLLFRLIERLHTVASTAFVFQTQCDSTQFMQYLLTELGSPTPGLNPGEMHDKINSIVSQEWQAGRRVIVIVDEAQNLQESVLETVRLFSNFETKYDKLMQIILAGQLQFMQKLERPELAQLYQRISTIARLQPLGPEETRQYIRYRLRIAGRASGELFTSDALYAVWEQSHGVPRIINTLCFNSLILAHSLKQLSIDRLIVRDVASQLQPHPVHQQSSRIVSAPNAGPIGWPEDVQDEELGNAFRLLTERVQAVTGAAGAALGILEGEYLVWRAASGSITPAIGERVSADCGPAGECIRTKQVVRCDESDTTSRIDHNICLDRSVKSILALPLCERETTVGVIEIFSTELNGFDHLHLLKLQAMVESMVLHRAATRGQQNSEPVIPGPKGTPPGDARIQEEATVAVRPDAESERIVEQSDADHARSVIEELAPRAKDPETLRARDEDESNPQPNAFENAEPTVVLHDATGIVDQSTPHGREAAGVVHKTVQSAVESDVATSAHDAAERKLADAPDTELPESLLTVPDPRGMSSEPQGPSSSVRRMPISIAQELSAENTKPNMVAELNHFIRNANLLTGATGAAIAICESGDMVCRASVGRNAPSVGIPVDLQHGIFGECVRSQRIVQCSDTRVDRRVDIKLCERLNIRSIIMLPICSLGTVAAVLGIFSDKPNAFDEQCKAELHQLIIKSSALLEGIPVVDRSIPTTLTNNKPCLHDRTLKTRVRQYHHYFATIMLIGSLLYPGAGYQGGSVGRVLGPNIPVVYRLATSSSSILARAQSGDPKYAAGDDIPRNDAEAFAWSNKAKEGHVPAQSALAPERTLGPEFTAATGPSSSGTSSTDADAEFTLGAKYAEGIGVREDYFEAVRWYSKAADHGSVPAQSMLGEAYRNGRGVPRDNVAAYMWFAIAESGGDISSKYRIALLRSRMKESDIANAQKLASDWLSRHSARPTSISNFSRKHPRK